jgi:hypothetical protein
MLPKIDVTTFFLSISQAAMQSLQTEKPNLEMAKHNIDLLELLQEKTKGNLTAAENELLTHLLFQLRMSFVQVEKKA